MAVTLTEAAARHVTRYLGKRGKGVGVRLGVKTTGCSGLAYKLEYADELAPDLKRHHAAVELGTKLPHGKRGTLGLAVIHRNAGFAIHLAVCIHSRVERSA